MTSITFKYKGQKVDIKEENSVDVFKSVCDWLYDNGYNFSGDVHNSGGRQIMSIDDINSSEHPISRFYNIRNSGKFIATTVIGNKSVRLRNIILILENFGIKGSEIQHEGFESSSRIKKFGEIDTDEEDFDEEDLTSTEEESMTFMEAAQYVLKKNDNRPMTSKEIWEQSKDLVETSGQTPELTMNAMMSLYSENSSAKAKKKKSLFRIIEGTRPYKFQLINPELEVQSVPDEEFDTELSIDSPKSSFEFPDDEILPFNHFRGAQAQEETEIKSPKKFVKNPFGCKDEDGSETSAICILGKSGSGKTTTTESALEQMGHEVLLYIPIEGEYTFSQFTGSGFEMSSLGEFIMKAQNNPSTYYTVIFDECHRPITISKLNTDLLQALSSRRNRGGERFLTMDRSTKRMYTSSSEEFPTPLKEKSGKILVPDNFGIVCLSSQPAVICRNEDFLNRVDVVIFNKRNRDIDDLTQFKKLEPNQKNIETIRGLLSSDGE